MYTDHIRARPVDLSCLPTLLVLSVWWEEDTSFKIWWRLLTFLCSAPCGAPFQAAVVERRAGEEMWLRQSLINTGCHVLAGETCRKVPHLRCSQTHRLSISFLKSPLSVIPHDDMMPHFSPSPNLFCFYPVPL